MRYALAFLLLLAACGGRVEDAGTFVDREPGAGVNTPEPVHGVPAWETISQGEFRGLDHTGEGIARLMERDGLLVLEFSSFRTDGEPDLRVYLSKDGTLDDAVDLGRLQSVRGYQSYGVPGFVDPDEYGHVLVHSRTLGRTFARAELE